MKDLFYDTREPIAALATPWGESALAVVRTTGEGSVEKFAPLFSDPGKILSAEGFTLHYGYLIDPSMKERVDQITAAVYRAPKSYTGQDSVEIFCHGSLPGIKTILKVLYKNGFREAAPGEFTLRSFLNGKMDLSRAEAVAEIIDAKSLRAHNLALNRLSGGVFNRIDGIKKDLARFMSTVEVQLDYPDDEIGGDIDLSLEPVKKSMNSVSELIDSFEVGVLYREGITAALAGGTNAGKSSLFNLFLREDRSIVSDIDGTTRDYIESWITLQGLPVRLFDTAGLRDALHPVEKEGVKRSNEIITNSALVLYLIDGQRGMSEADKKVVEENRDNRRYIFVWNKIDAGTPDVPPWAVPVSALSGEGFSGLEEAVVDRILGSRHASGGGVMIDSLRQKNLLEKSLAALKLVEEGIKAGVSLDGVAMDLKDALDALGEITGEVTSDEILNSIFSNFCVGK